MSTSSRSGRITRKTQETDIDVTWTLPAGAPGQSRIDTPLPFFSHMLQALAKHSATQLSLRAHGDVEVDGHHTVEDVGLALGQALDTALGTREGIARFGASLLPMDEARVECAVDLGGRPYLVFDADILRGRWVGTFDCDLVEEFFRALTVQARMNLHLIVHAGKNAHHVTEACFKACARALREAVRPDPVMGMPSTKGML